MSPLPCASRVSLHSVLSGLVAMFCTLFLAEVAAAQPSDPSDHSFLPEGTVRMRAALLLTEAGEDQPERLPVPTETIPPGVEKQIQLFNRSSGSGTAQPGAPLGLTLRVRIDYPADSQQSVAYQITSALRDFVGRDERSTGSEGDVLRTLVLEASAKGEAKLGETKRILAGDDPVSGRRVELEFVFERAAGASTIPASQPSATEPPINNATVGPTRPDAPTGSQASASPNQQPSTTPSPAKPTVPADTQPIAPPKPKPVLRRFVSAPQPWVTVTALPSDQIENLALGDLNRDGTTDIVTVFDRELKWFDPRAAGKGWQRIEKLKSKETLRDVVVADRQGNGRAEIILRRDKRFRYRSINEDWQKGSEVGAPLHELLFINLPGVGAGYFRAHQAYINRGSITGDESRWNTATASLKETRVGFFDNDEQADLVFVTRNQQYAYTSNGRGAVRPLGPAHWPLPETRQGDVDGDGLTDLVTIVDGALVYSSGARHTPQVLVAPFNYPLNAITIRDMNGDGIDDLVCVADKQLRYLPFRPRRHTPVY